MKNYEKLYNSALERARRLEENSNGMILKKWLWNVFPELAESEDERIRKELLAFLKEELYTGGRAEETWDTKGLERWIAWLEKQGTKEVDPRYENLEELLVADDIYQMSMNEAMVEEAKSKAINALSELEISKLLGIEKQGEKPQGKSALEAIKEEKVDNSNKVGPKFKVGCWIACEIACETAYEELNTAKIIDINDDRYTVEFIDGHRGVPHIDYIDRNFHLWTIQDAKDGDVLTVNGKPFIYCYNDDYQGNYCCIDSVDVFRTGLDFGFNGKTILPATKEQREFLFARMREAGYEWNDEKKELKKIGLKFKVGDWICNGGGNPCKVNCIFGNYYEFCSTEGYQYGKPVSDIDKTFHLWTIQDANDGDVLAAHECYVIFKEIDGLNIKCYCTYHYMNNPSFHVDTLQNKDAFLPATKEQCDTLMKAMADDGYTFDFEKKELKKVEEEVNGEDYGIDGLYHAQEILERTLGKVDGYQSDDGILEHKCAISAVKKLYEQKPIWSEEDEQKLIKVISIVQNISNYDNQLDEYIEWLKSLKERVLPQNT